MAPRPVAAGRRAFRCLGRATLLTLGIVGAAGPLPAMAQTTPGCSWAVVEPPPEQQAIVAVRLDDMLLSDGAFALWREEELYFSLGELVALLELGIEIDAARGTAEGFVVDEARVFRLDAGCSTLAIDGSSLPLEPSTILGDGRDLYVVLPTLERWFPVEAVFEPRGMLLSLSARGELPVLARLAREQRHERLARRRAARSGDGGQGLERITAPYRALSMPSVDLSGKLTLDRPQHAETSGLYSYSALSSGDLAFLNGRVYVAGNETELVERLRLSLERRSPDGDLLGPLAGTELALGDLLSPSRDLVSRGTPMRGFLVSSFPLQQAAGAGTTLLSGEMPLGWAVELYRDVVLLDVAEADDEGRFVFEDVPLLSGTNLFRLEFYGPQGQRRTETRQIVLGPGLIEAGHHYWRASAGQTHKSLLGIGDEEREEAGDIRASVEHAYGLTERITLSGALDTLRMADGRHDYAQLGTDLSLGPVAVQASGIRDLAGGRALRAVARTRIAGAGVLAEAARFDELASEHEREVLESRLRLRLDGPVRLPPIPVQSYGIEAKREARSDGRRRDTLSGRLSGRLGRVLVTHTAEGTAERGAGVDEDRLRGALLMSGRLASVYLRGNVGYAVAPETELGTTALSGQWSRGGDVSLAAGLAHDWREDGTTSINASASRKFSGFTLGTFLRASMDGDVTAGLSFNVALGREPGRGSWVTSPEGLAGKGAVAARVFLDRNANGVLDEGDEPVPGARVNVNAAGQRTVTDEKGRMLALGVPAARPMRVALDVASLEDPYMMPLREAVEVVVHPGAGVTVDFPVVMTGGAEGHVVREDGRIGARLAVLAVDAGGTVVERTLSDGEGYFVVEGLRPGAYRLEVEENGVAIASLALEIGPDGDYRSGLVVAVPAAAAAAQSS